MRCLKFLHILMVCVLLCMMFCVPSFAEEYSTEYPPVGNSGSPLWIHCEVEGMGEYVIVIDPNTNLQTFGFDSPTGYNLINNSSSTVVGRAYSVSSSTGYGARWLSYYKLQLQTGTSSYGQSVYEDYNITKIYGTTMDLIDYVGDRDNDLYKYDIPQRQTNIIIVVSLTMFVLLFAMFMIFKPRLLRM